jgi:hypothetical protein
MTLYDIKGRLISKNVNKYLVEWDEPSLSKCQFAVKQFLKPFWRSSLVYEEFPVFGSKLRVDLLNGTYKIAIEVHGGQHESAKHFFHNNNPLNYLNSYKRDVAKMDWLKANGFQLMEIYEHETKHLSKEFFKEKFNLTL